MIARGAWSPYCGVAPDPASWLMQWNLDPVVLVGLALALLFVLRRPGRDSRLWGGLGVAVLAVSFVSPLCALSSALFAARTLHHVLLVAVAAPLLAAALPRPLKAGIWAVVVQTLVFWAWHAPAAYDWALSNDLVYWLMQGSLLLSSIWFWGAVRGASAPAAIALLLVAMVAMGLLGALLTFADAPLYAPHWISAEVWGLGALRDQQIAGLIMWAPAAGAYLAAALARLSRLLGPAAVAKAPAG